MTTDAEIHFWKYSQALRAPLITTGKKMQEDMLPQTVQLNLKRNGMESCVAVAAESAEVETRFLSELMKTNPVIRGVIGWLDLEAPDAADKIEEFAGYPEIRGYKLELKAAAAFPGASVMNALAARQYTLDLDLTRAPETGTIKKWIDSWPEQQFIISNCGNPDATKPPAEDWTATMQALAGFPNVNCKVAGLFTRAAWNKWRPADFYPFLETLFEGFGAGRLLYGSDWPFMLLSGSYVQWKSLLDKFTGHLNEDDRDDFYGNNATRLYRL